MESSKANETPSLGSPWLLRSSSSKASSSGSTRHDSNINSNGNRALDSTNGGKDAAVRSWWRSPGEWGPLDDPVHSVTVYTIWPRFKSGTFVDNDSYSDLVASQAPEWYIRATFKDGLDLPLSSATNRLVVENETAVKASSSDTSGDAGQTDSIEADVGKSDDEDDEFEDACATVEEQESSRRKLCYSKMDIIRSANSPAIANVNSLPSLREALQEGSVDVRHAEKMLSLATALLAHFPSQFRLVDAMLAAD